jgi:hypothetical protein
MRDSCNKPISEKDLSKIAFIADSIGAVKYGRLGSHVRKVRTDGRYFQLWFYGPAMDSMSCDSLIKFCYDNGGANIYMEKPNGDIDTVQGYWSGSSPPCVPCGCNGYAILDSLFHVLNEHYTPATDSCNRYK